MLLDHVVHGDLYNHGLRFDQGWATQYWMFSRMMWVFVTAVVIITGTSLIFILLRRRGGASLLVYILFIAGIVLSGFSLFIFLSIDNIVHVDLYSYGLVYSDEWALKYWTYANRVMTLIGFSMITTFFSLMLFSTGQGFQTRGVEKGRVVALSLLSTGVISIAVSALYNSAALAFVSLGLTLWGAILLYIQPGRYVKEELLMKTALPSLENLDGLITQIGYRGKGVYLPPEYLKNLSSGKVYLGAQENNDLPSPEEIQDREDHMFTQESALVIPPGNELLNLFEEKMGTDFTRLTLKDLEKDLPKLLIEDLEAAQRVEIRNRSRKIRVEIQSATYENLWKAASKLKVVWNSLGDPVASAIACAMAKASGRPVVIEKNRFNPKRQTLHVEYRLLTEK
jgi:hypothetical protein